MPTPFPLWCGMGWGMLLLPLLLLLQLLLLLLPLRCCGYCCWRKGGREGGRAASPVHALATLEYRTAVTIQNTSSELFSEIS